MCMLTVYYICEVPMQYFNEAVHAWFNSHILDSAAVITLLANNSFNYYSILRTVMFYILLTKKFQNVLYI